MSRYTFMRRPDGSVCRLISSEVEAVEKHGWMVLPYAEGEQLWLAGEKIPIDDIEDEVSDGDPEEVDEEGEE